MEAASVRDVFTPSQRVALSTRQVIIAIHVALWLVVWTMVPWKLIPSPTEVVSAFGRLWSQGFAVELWTSFWLNIEALLYASALSLTIVYAGSIPAFRPYLGVLSRFRFMGVVGWSLAFTLMFGGGHYLKVALMVFATTGFMVTGMADVVANIDTERRYHARTLRAGPWKEFWWVVVMGTRAEMAALIIQNAAIGWTMLTMVEGISRSEGGVGVMLLSQNKFFRLDAIVAIQLTILSLALVQDWVFRFAHRMLFPYAYLGKERS